MSLGHGYILAFAALIAAGLVGVVVLPGAPILDAGPSGAGELWFRATSGA